MAEQEYFRQALSDFTFDMAAGGMIRHLAEKGYTVKQIMNALDYPIPYEKVRRTVWDYLLKLQVLLLEKPGTGIQQQKTVYVEERGKFGKKSFRKVTISAETCQKTHWKEISCGSGKETELLHLLSETCVGTDGKSAYVSCDYGILQQQEPKQFSALLDVLKDRQKEYIEGLPWVNRRVYHCLDQRMLEIVSRQLQTGQFYGNCYFEQKEVERQ